MASVFSRGPKAFPRWYARYKAPSGAWISRRVRQETKREAMTVARALEAKAERQRMGMEAPESASILFRDLARRWEASLVNRAASDDRSRLRLHILPRWGSCRLQDITTSGLIAWCDEEHAVRPRRVSPHTLKHCLSIMSRCWGWALGLNLTTLPNPVRAIPAGRRPHAPSRRRIEWIADDAVVRELIAKLPEPVNLMFYLGVGSGMRLGETCGLRMSSVETLDAGAILVAGSYGSPYLKEDRRCVGKTKWVPAPADARAVLGPWIERRLAAGAQPNDFLFPDEFGRAHDKAWVQYRWNRTATTLGVTLGWKDATRTSFASRCVSRGIPVDEVAQALGHRDSRMVSQHYNHFQRREFSPMMTAGFGLGAPGPGKVIPIGSGRPAVSEAPQSTPVDAPVARPAVTANGGRG